MATTVNQPLVSPSMCLKMTDSGGLGAGGKEKPLFLETKNTFLRCMHLARTHTAPTIHPFLCESGRWEQTNELTDWLDAGNVYGSSEEELEHVRDQRDEALLAVSRGNLLPTCSALRAR